MAIRRLNRTRAVRPARVVGEGLAAVGGSAGAPVCGQRLHLALGVFSTSAQHVARLARSYSTPCCKAGIAEWLARNHRRVERPCMPVRGSQRSFRSGFPLGLENANSVLKYSDGEDRFLYRTRTALLPRIRGTANYGRGQSGRKDIKSVICSSLLPRLGRGSGSFKMPLRRLRAKMGRKMVDMTRYVPPTARPKTIVRNRFEFATPCY